MVELGAKFKVLGRTNKTFQDSTVCTDGVMQEQLSLRK